MEDLDALLAIEKASFPKVTFSREYILWLLSNPNALAYIYIHEGEPVGSMMVMKMGGKARILSIAVLPSHRRMGIGKSMMLMLEDELIRRGIKKITLEVRISNDVAINLYRGLGYAIDGFIENYYPGGEHAYIMSKTLD